MPKSEKVSEQLGNNSIQSTQSVREYRKLLRNLCSLPSMRKIDESELSNQTYQVSLCATATTSPYGLKKDLEFTDVYKATHPLHALGWALADINSRFFDISVDLKSIRISIR
jgi:hypothetical protein